MSDRETPEEREDRYERTLEKVSQHELAAPTGSVAGAVPRYHSILLPCGATATVTDDIKPETIEALDAMCRTVLRNVTAKPHNDQAEPRGEKGTNEL